jgi:hypothetical protein
MGEEVQSGHRYDEGEEVVDDGVEKLVAEGSKGLSSQVRGVGGVLTSWRATAALRPISTCS